MWNTTNVAATLACVLAAASTAEAGPLRNIEVAAEQQSAGESQRGRTRPDGERRPGKIERPPADDFGQTQPPPSPKPAPSQAPSQIPDDIPGNAISPDPLIPGGAQDPIANRPMRPERN